MAKNIFRDFEIKTLNNNLLLTLSKSFEAETVDEEASADPIIDFPTVEELRQEAEQFRTEWEAEKKEIIQKARQEAAEILESAKKEAFEEVTEQIETAKHDAQKIRDSAKVLVTEAEKKAAETIKKAEDSQAETLKKAHEEGFSAGHEEGFNSGKDEVDRLIARLHTMIERTMDKREQILAETEQQIVDLVLLMTRKVVKVISENQKNVVASNIIHALRKVKTRGEVILRVNIADTGLTTQHTKDFLAAIEQVTNITVVEDLSVDKGGCIVETDFGAVDARIASQLHELEQRILEISPIKTRTTADTMAKHVAL